MKRLRSDRDYIWWMLLSSVALSDGVSAQVNVAATNTSKFVFVPLKIQNCHGGPGRAIAFRVNEK